MALLRFRLLSRPENQAERERDTYRDPGPIALPKGGAHSYMTLENTTLVWKTLDGAVMRTLEL